MSGRATAGDREARWRDRVAGGLRQVAVGEREGSLAGVVSWRRDESVVDAPSLELMSLYVRPDLWGTGVAPVLLDAAVGLEPARLWVFEDNLRARRFYAKHGSARTG